MMDVTLEEYLVKGGFYYKKYLEKLREAFEFAILAHMLDNISYDNMITWSTDINARLKYLKESEKERGYL